MKFSRRDLNRILKDRKGIKELKIEKTLYLGVDEMSDSPFCEFILADKTNYSFKTKVSFDLVIDFDNEEVTIEDVEQVGKIKLPREYKYQKNWVKEFRNYNDLDILLSDNTEFLTSILENLDLNNDILNELCEFTF